MMRVICRISRRYNGLKRKEERKRKKRNKEKK